MKRLLPAIAVMALTTTASAQEAPTATELLAEMKVSFECEEPILTLADKLLVYGGQTRDEDMWEVWSRDQDTFRAERDDGWLVIRTREKMTIYVPAPANVGLVLTKETIEEAGDKLPEWLKYAGIELPAAPLAPLREVDEEIGEWSILYEGEWSVPDDAGLAEIEVDWPASDEVEFGEECWVVTLSPDGLEALDAARNQDEGKDDGVATEAVHLAIGKETSYWRGLCLTQSHPEKPEPWTIDVRLTHIEAGVEIEDASFVWTPPANAKMITWTPDNGRQAIGEFRAATGNDAMAKYRKLEAKLRAAVEAGEMTGEEARRKLGEFRRQLGEAKGR